ncbi:hypothetical protein [Sphaerisporangium dianthi]|uniref:META domain-containing protein n=1 Tax=Sphaerisporangium dianthi TaxID=1436120 RepID=A0ABV9CQ42_9ACTN
MVRPLAVISFAALCAVASFTGSAQGAATSLTSASPAASATFGGSASSRASATSEAPGTTAVYGFAWADGKGALRVIPVRATLHRKSGPPRYTFTAVPGAKERRVDYSRASFRRVTSACDLKETEGVVKVDAKGLGATRCKPADLAFALSLGPTPVKISLGAAKRVYEVLAMPGSARTAYGTIKRVNDTTVMFTRGGKSIKLGYTGLSFGRTTRSCGAAWSAGRSNADKRGLGRKVCSTADFTKALKSAKRPVAAKIDYTPLSGRLDQVWEISAR